MTLITILIGLLLERWLGSFESWRRYTLIDNGFVRLKQRIKSINTNTLLMLYLFIPVVVVLYLEYRFGFFMIFVLSLLTLVFTLGPKDLEGQAEALIDAWHRGDRITIHWYASDLIGDFESENTPEMIRRTLSTIFQESLRRYFAVFFWFIAFGAAGALLFRMTQILAESGNHQEKWLIPVYSILLWFPSRLLALSFGLAGSFEDTAEQMHEFTSIEIDSHMSMVERSGFAALRLSEDALSGFDDELINHVIDAMAMVRRVLLIWLALLAVAVLSGWSI